MFLLLKELLPPDGLPARTHPLGRGVFNETPSRIIIINCHTSPTPCPGSVTYFMDSLEERSLDGFCGFGEGF